MAITLRNVKGSELTHAEMDTNFTDLRDGVNLMVPKTMGKGLKIGPNGSETFGWHDLTGTLSTYGLPGEASRQLYRGGIHAIQCAEGEHAHVDFHMPHDYVMGTDVYIHVHWSHTGTLVTGGSLTWGFELMYAKGHDQAAFPEPITVSVVQNASTTQYQHMIAEGLASTPGGSPVLLDTSLLEVDGLIQCRVYLDSNDMTVSGGLVPDPFIHMVDIHYQSTGTPTKNRAPNFWA
jgi:hypothetical protein